MAKVLFLQRDGYESFGVMYLASALAARGHRTDVVIEGEEGRGFLDTVRQIAPDVVAFSIMSGLQDWAAATAAKVKAALGRVTVIAGGPHCTFFPEFVETPDIDALCRGEAEDALPDFCDRLDAGTDASDVPGFWVKTTSGLRQNDLYPLRADLDSLPPPDRTLYLNRYPALIASQAAELLVARGCPYSCSFCYNKLIRGLYRGKGPYIRRHSPDRVLAELAELRRLRPRLGYVTFVDDLFVQDRSWLTDFLTRYRAEVGLPFMCGVRANLVDKPLVDLLADSGCRMVSFGLESGDDDLRNRVLNKKVSREQIVNTARLLADRGLVFSTFNMFNLPGETLEKALATLRLNQEIRRGNHPWSGLLQPYRGTGVYDIAESMGLLPKGETGANLFHSPTIKQPDTDALARFNAYFYWMVRYPRVEPLLMPLVRRHVPALATLSSLLVSFHRYVSLYAPFEGRRAWWVAAKAGLKRMKSYL